MNTKLVLNYLGRILHLEGALMLPALIIAIVKGESECVKAFIAAITLLALSGLACRFIKPENKQINNREGFAIVSFAWIAMSLFGAFPFYFSGEISGFVNCFFETVSGFTTTGASIIHDVEAMSSSLLYWRAFLCWLGGMGILVFVLAFVQPAKGGGSSFMLLRAESPGPIIGKLVPKMRQTARILYLIYIALTVLEIILLLAGGMSFFDSVSHAFSTAGTGGFSVKNLSIGTYSSPYIQNTIAVFMMLFGINFNMFYMLLLRNFSSVLKNEELRVYCGVIAASTAVIAINIFSIYKNPLVSLRYSFFQVVSVMTTTGFSTADFSVWPEFSQCLLVFLMFVGACAGSTGGGMKISRILILLKSLRVSLQKLIHPRSVKVIKMNGELVDSTTVNEANVYMTVYILITAASVLIISIDDFDFLTTTTSVISCLNNIGPGFGDIGPLGNFSAFSLLGKLVLSLNMLFGRLELFPLLLMFSPSTWKKSR